MKKIGIAVCVALSLVGLYTAFVLVQAEYQSYRGQQVATAQMFQFLSETVGTRKDGDNKDAPVTRADVLGMLVAERLQKAQSEQQ